MAQISVCGIYLLVMLLKEIAKQILFEHSGLGIVETDDEGGSIEIDKKLTEKTLDDTFELSDEGMFYVNNILTRLNKKATKLGLPPLSLRVISKRIEKLSDPVKQIEKVITIHTVKVEGKSPIIAGYEFVASVEHTPAGNIINVSPNSSVKQLPAEYKTASATCDYCHTKRDRNNTFILKKTATGEFKRIGRNCLKNFMPDADPANILNYASLLGKTLASLIAGEEIEDSESESGGGGGGGGSGKNYYDAVEFLKFICLAYILDGKKFTSRKAQRAILDAGGSSTTTADFAKLLMNIKWQSPKVRDQYVPLIQAHMADAEKLAEKVEEWKDAKDWDAEAEKKPDMATYFNNMKVISNSPAIQYKNAGYHASLLAVYLREKEWNERKAAEKTQSATKSYIGKIGDKMTFDLTLKKDMSFDGQYGTTYMYIFNDSTGNEVVYFSSRDLGLEQGQNYKIVATIKDHKPSKFNQVPQTIITRGKVV